MSDRRSLRWLAASLCLLATGCYALHAPVDFTADRPDTDIYVDGQYAGKGLATVDTGIEYGFPRSHAVKLVDAKGASHEWSIATERDAPRAVQGMAELALFGAAYVGAGYAWWNGATFQSPGDRTNVGLTLYGLGGVLIGLTPLVWWSWDHFHPGYAFDLAKGTVTPRSWGNPTDETLSGADPDLLAARDVIRRQALSPPDDSVLEAGALKGLLHAASEDARVPAVLASVDPAHAFRTYRNIRASLPPGGAFDRAALEGLVATLDPKLARLVPAPAATSSIKGDSWVGLDLMARDRKLVVRRTIPGSPAWKAGLALGDRVLSIDGHVVGGDDLTPAYQLLDGAPDTTVRLAVQRGSGRPATITFRRREIGDGIQPVSGTNLGAGVAYLRVLTFGHGAAARIADQVPDVDGTRGLVLDLRGTEEGTLRDLWQVGQTLLPKGAVIAHLAGRGATTFRAVSTASVDVSIPMAVLVDGGTSTDAEAIAQALREAHRATLIGQRTAGDTAYFQAVPLPGGPQLVLASLRLVGGNGRTFDQGLDPDVVVAQPAVPLGKRPDRDPAMDAAVDLLLNGLSLDALRHKYQ